MSVLGNSDKTQRGFGIIKFTDFYDYGCSLQQSSLATEEAIWLGVDDVNPQILVAGQGWTKIPMPEGYLAHSRMHLNRKQVQQLVVELNKWLDTGEVG